MKNEEAKDIVPELFDKIDKTFKLKAKESKIIKDKLKVLKNNKANYKDANEFAVEVGKILADTFQDEIKTGDLPDGKMYYNIAKRLIEPNMVKNHNLVSEYSKEVQSILNKKANISIKAQKADLNQDRIDKLIDKITGYDSYEDGKWLLKEPVINFSQAVVDETIKKNANLHYKSGLNPKIIRKEHGNCCDWCKEIVGTYFYPDIPEDIYRRHRHCRCTVDYYPGDGKRHDVWSKKWKNVNEDDKIEERIKLSKNKNEKKKEKTDRPKTLEKFKDYQQKWEDDVVKKELSEKDIKLIGKNIGRLLDENEFCMRVNSSDIEKILADGRFKNQLETKTSGGALNPELRRKATKQLFGKGGIKNIADFEKYGYLGDKDYIYDIHYSTTSQYGDIIVRFDKEKLKNKVTYTVDDSLGYAYNKEIVAGDVEAPRANGIGGKELSRIKNIFKEHDCIGLTDFTEESGARYIELQYHGEMKTDFIKEMCFTQYLPSQEVIDNLKSRGVKLFKVEGEWDEEEIFKI